MADAQKPADKIPQRIYCNPDEFWLGSAKVRLNHLSREELVSLRAIEELGL